MHLLVCGVAAKTFANLRELVDVDLPTAILVKFVEEPSKPPINNCFSRYSTMGSTNQKSTSASPDCFFEVTIFFHLNNIQASLCIGGRGSLSHLVPDSLIHTAIYI